MASDLIWFPVEPGIVDSGCLTAHVTNGLWADPHLLTAPLVCAGAGIRQFNLQTIIDQL